MGLARAGAALAPWAAWMAATGGIAMSAVAAGVASPAALAAADRDWSPFVLVAGLLLVGLVVDDDGLFAAAGRRLATLARSDAALLLGSAVLVTAVTAVLNLDTSVAFVTPVVVHAMRHRRAANRVPVAACLLLSNAGSLLLPGANLTNLIVLGGDRLAGAQFFLRAAPAWAAAVLATTAVVAVARWHENRVDPGSDESGPPADGGAASARSGVPADGAAAVAGCGTEIGAVDRPRLGLGLAAAVAVAVLVVTLADAALPVLAIGLACVTARLLQRRTELRHVVQVLGPGMLLGLFGMAVALGTLGRRWHGPTHLVGHLGRLATAAVGAATSVLVNNLPAASLLAAGPLRHPVALLVGLDVGPNLFATGSLSWILWLRAARQAGDEPSVAFTTRLGLVAAPLALVAAVGMLMLTG